MIDQVLDFTRIRLGKGIPIEVRRTDLAEVCRLAIDEFETVIPAHRVDLLTTGDPVGSWDGDRLMQLVSNLLSNALAHGTASGRVTIAVDGTDEAKLTLDVHNAGAVPAAIMPVLFEPFRCGANEKQERSNGLGLGLFISQQIVLAHSGTIDVSSSEATGTRLVVRLPRNLRRLDPPFASPRTIAK
jgi:two-component system sensor histidine kinase/response regulator